MKRISTMIRTAAFLASAAVLFSGISTAAAPARSTSLTASSQASSSAYIGRERAKQIAAEKYGLKTEDLIFTKVKIDRENGRTVYEIDYYTAEAEYELEIDAISGEIREASEEMFRKSTGSSSGAGTGRSYSSSSQSSGRTGRYYYDDDDWDDRWDDDWDDRYDDWDDRYDDDWDDRWDDDDDDDWDDRWDDDDDDWDDD